MPADRPCLYSIVRRRCVRPNGTVQSVTRRDIRVMAVPQRRRALVCIWRPPSLTDSHGRRHPLLLPFNPSRLPPSNTVIASVLQLQTLWATNLFRLQPHRSYTLKNAEQLQLLTPTCSKHIENNKTYKNSWIHHRRVNICSYMYSPFRTTSKLQRS